MTGLLDPQLTRNLSFLLYRYRFLLSYVVIGICSIVLEIISLYGLEVAGLHSPFSNLVAVALGVTFAFAINVRFNFKVPAPKRNRAFILFASISLFSLTINFIFKHQLESYGWDYGQARFVVAGCFFLLGYALHRRFSFADRKQVGVAVYANGVEDIQSIYNRIGLYPDFIHVDIIDESYGEKDQDPKIYRLEVIRAYWPGKSIQVHIMSRTPSRWVEEVAAYADLIIIHKEIDENVDEILASIHSRNLRAGLCLTVNTPVEEAKEHLPKLDTLMLLTIAKPGQSGQKFHMEALNSIENINSWPQRGNFQLCIDGGVSEQNIGHLTVERVVSGSSVLCHENPAKQIMRLQTSSSYERV